MLDDEPQFNCRPQETLKWNLLLTIHRTGGSKQNNLRGHKGKLRPRRERRGEREGEGGRGKWDLRHMPLLAYLIECF